MYRHPSNILRYPANDFRQQVKTGRTVLLPFQHRQDVNQRQTNEHRQPQDAQQHPLNAHRQNPNELRH
jgi:hypothetical protein